MVVHNLDRGGQTIRRTARRDLHFMISLTIMASFSSYGTTIN
jgi:hypothetical protein